MRLVARRRDVSMPLAGFRAGLPEWAQQMLFLMPLDLTECILDGSSPSTQRNKCPKLADCSKASVMDLVTITSRANLSQ